MKKFIFYQLKSMQQHCLTFSCNRNAGLSSFSSTNKSVKKLFLYGALLFFAFAQTSLYSQKTKASANLDQVRNGSGATTVTPDAVWVNGNLNASQAHYAEGYSIPYRLVMTNLTTTGEHQLIIEWDIKHSGKNALDYITSYENLDNPSGSHKVTFGHEPEDIDPTIGITSVGSASTFEIPEPGSLASPVTNMPTQSFKDLDEKLMTIYGGTITDIDYLSEGDLNAAQSSTRLLIKFTATQSNVVIAWGGHIAAEYDWGQGQGATAVSGSPYHTRLISLDGSGGNQDRSLAAAAVKTLPTCMVLGTSSICPAAEFVVLTSSVDNASGVTYSWALDTGNSAGATIDGATNTDQITVKPSNTTTGFTTGYFIATLTVTRDGVENTCIHQVDVSPLPAAPTLKITEPSLCGTSTTGSIEVCNPVLGYTYKLFLNDVFDSFVDAKDGPDDGSLVDPVVFILAAGTNPSVTVTNTDGCTSAAALCTNATTDACPAPPLTAAKTTNTVSKKTKATPIEATTEKAGFDAYPVPFKDQLSIKYNFDYESDVKIEVFNAQGIRVFSKTDANGYLNKETALDLKMNKGKEQMYVVKITTNRGSTTRKVMSSK